MTIGELIEIGRRRADFSAHGWHLIPELDQELLGIHTSHNSAPLLDVNSDALVPDESTVLLNGAMDVKTIRRTNLEGLIGQFETITALAEQTGTVASVLSQIKNGTRGMGHVVARKLESGLDKPFGWMDTLHFKSPDDAMNQTEAAQICATLSDADREQWLRLGRLMVENGEKGPNNPFGAIKKGHSGLTCRSC